MTRRAHSTRSRSLSIACIFLFTKFHSCWLQPGPACNVLTVKVTCISSRFSQGTWSASAQAQVASRIASLLVSWLVCATPHISEHISANRT
ncbi:hypothetical protein EDB86DRAFT_2382674 [Lactarius hatsudake]|nr:hypothetical protein EDB86DRAFT_2382674 [Lactarius hatsudake]